MLTDFVFWYICFLLYKGIFLFSNIRLEHEHALFLLSLPLKQDLNVLSERIKISLVRNVKEPVQNAKAGDLASPSNTQAAVAVENNLSEDRGHQELFAQVFHTRRKHCVALLYVCVASSINCGTSSGGSSQTGTRDSSRSGTTIARAPQQCFSWFPNMYPCISVFEQVAHDTIALP